MPEFRGKWYSQRQLAQEVQRAIVYYVGEYWQEHRASPSRREIAQAMRWAHKGTAQKWVRRMIDGGLLEDLGNRGVRLTDKGQKQWEMSWYGKEAKVSKKTG